MRGRRLLPLLLLAAAGCSGASGTAYERGAAAFAEGDMRTARVELMNALAADPADVRARLLQARVQLALGDGVGAEAEVARAREAGAPVEQTAHLLAHARLIQRDLPGALAEAEHAAPEHEAYAQRMRARAFMALDDMLGARNALDLAHAAAPPDAALWTEIARFRRVNGDFGGAIAAADHAVRLGPRDVEALTLRGELARAQYGLAAALPWFDRALEVDPANVTALLERAITYGDMGRMRDMLADARRVHAATGGHPVAFYLQAALAARGGRFELARDLLARTGGSLDHLPSVALLAGAVELETGAAAQAALRLADLVARQPGNRKARRLLAAAYWRSGDAAATIETLIPIVNRPDADPYSLSLIGRALARRSQHGPAAHYLARAAQPQPAARAVIERLTDADFDRLRAATEANPGNEGLQARFVSALLSRGAADEALARARRLQAARPGAPEFSVMVGDALGLAGDPAAAAEQYRRAANIAFSEGTAIRLIEALDRTGNGADADRVLRLFLDQNPRNVPALILLAGRAMQAGDWAGAATIYEGLRARLGDRDATLLNNLAWAYAQTGDYERALPAAEAAWSLDPDNPATTDTYGWLLFKAGRRAEGLALLQRAARGAPSDAEIQRRLQEAARS